MGAQRKHARPMRYDFNELEASAWRLGEGRRASLVRHQPASQLHWGTNGPIQEFRTSYAYMKKYSMWLMMFYYFYVANCFCPSPSLSPWPHLMYALFSVWPPKWKRYDLANRSVGLGVIWENLRWIDVQWISMDHYRINNCRTGLLIIDP